MVIILIDIGSTHNFIDFQVAKEVKATLIPTTPLIVTVTNGYKVVSKLKYANFQQTIQGEPYQRVIRLDGSSIILGIDWLRTYGKITFDYLINSMTFTKDGKQMMLKGMTKGSKLKSTKAKLQSIIATQWYKARLKEKYCTIGYLKNLEKHKVEEEIPTLVREVQELYSEVF